MAVHEANYAYGFGTAQSYTNAYKARMEGAVSHKSCWDVLEVLPGASEAVVKAAYKALALRHHPDRGGSEENMKRLNGAFDDALKIIGTK